MLKGVFLNQGHSFIVGLLWDYCGTIVGLVKILFEFEIQKKIR
jgi:hypothetical protein